MFDVDAVGMLARELVRERVATLVAEACAWSVGLSDAPHRVRRHGRVVATVPRSEDGRRLACR